MAILGFAVVQACRFTENDVLCEWIAGANGPEVHTAGGKRAESAHVNPTTGAKTHDSPP